MIRRLFNSVAVVSLLLCVAVFGEELLRFADDDFSVYWSSNGRMISVDSFEDTPHGNAITVRRFSPMPVDVPLQFRNCAVEAGTDVPCPGVGKSVELRLDEANQPVSRHEPGHSAGPITVSVLMQIPLDHAGAFLLLTALTPALWCVARQRKPRVRRKRREGRLCLSCGYDLRASTGRCPEFGMLISGEEQA